MLPKKIYSFFLESPLIKTLIFVLSAILAAIFSATFVIEITRVDDITHSQSLAWSLFYRTNSFYILLGISSFILLYNIAQYRREKNIEKFISDDYAKAYMRSKCLPEIAAKYNQEIKSGAIEDSSFNEIKELLL